MQVISTGSRALDALLLGGVRRGLLYCVFGASGSGKTQLCMQLALNSARSSEKARVFIVDAKGDFRPERIIDIYRATYMNYSERNGGSGYGKDINTIMSIMNRIYVQRAYHVDDILNSLCDVYGMHDRYDHGVSLLIVEDSPSLFRLEYGSRSAEGHFRLMRLMHDLALRAVLRNTAVIVTNGIVSAMGKHGDADTTTVPDSGFEEGMRMEMGERQIMDRSVSMFTHFKVRLERQRSKKMKEKEGEEGMGRMYGSLFKATLLQPLLTRNNTALFSIVERGIVDI